MAEGVVIEPSSVESTVVNPSFSSKLSYAYLNYELLNKGAFFLMNLLESLNLNFDAVFKAMIASYVLIDTVFPPPPEISKLFIAAKFPTVYYLFNCAGLETYLKCPTPPPFSI